MQTSDTCGKAHPAFAEIKSQAGEKPNAPTKSKKTHDNPVCFVGRNWRFVLRIEMRRVETSSAPHLVYNVAARLRGHEQRADTEEYHAADPDQLAGCHERHSVESGMVYLLWEQKLEAVE